MEFEEQPFKEFEISLQKANERPVSIPNGKGKAYKSYTIAAIFYKYQFPMGKVKKLKFHAFQ